MKNLGKLTLLFALTIACASFASAQATRTWVSGVGDDANPCSRTAPCKTFAGAISKTAAGGEIDALDPGGFGTVTITKAITIDGGEGQNASILASGTNGITIVAGAGEVVTIRNLSINGINGSGSPGVDGIKFNSGGGLNIEHCVIFGFGNNGVNIATTGGGQVSILDSIINNNTMNGLNVLATSTAVNVAVSHSSFQMNGMNGVDAADFSRVTVSDSNASANGANGFLVNPNSDMSYLNVENSVAANNASAGLRVGGGSVPATARINGLSLIANSHGIVINTNGTVRSFGNNYNTGDGAPNGAAITPQ